MANNVLMHTRVPQELRDTLAGADLAGALARRPDLLPAGERLTESSAVRLLIGLGLQVLGVAIVAAPPVVRAQAGAAPALATDDDVGF